MGQIDFEITRPITPWIVLHSVQLLLLIAIDYIIIDDHPSMPSFSLQFEWLMIVRSNYHVFQ